MLRISRDAARLVIATGLALATGLAANVEAGAAEWQSASDIQKVLMGTGTELSGYQDGTLGFSEPRFRRLARQSRVDRSTDFG